MSGGGKSENPYLLTLPQLISAKKKIGRVAAFYDPKKMSFKGFDAEALDPTQFREQLRRNFLISLSDSELGAIVLLFDKDGDGQIDSTEFINEFFRLGRQEREKFNQKVALVTKRKLAEKEKRRQTHEAKFVALTKVKIPTTFTKEDEKRAVRKVAEVSFSYDSQGSPAWLGGGLKGFMAVGSLDPQQFQEQMRRIFEVYLTGHEVAALLTIFDTDGNGEIDCAEFLYTFFRIGRTERDRHRIRQAKRTKELLEAERLRKAATKEKYGKMSLAKLSTATEEDKKSAMAKIKKAATFHQGAVLNGGKSFEAKALTPTEFKEQLKRNWLILLSPGELDALLQVFDSDGDGTVSVVEFLTTFFRIGSEEKKKIIQKHRRLKGIYEKAEKERILKKMEAALALTHTNVDWPDLPDDSDEEDDRSSSTDGLARPQTSLPSSPITRLEIEQGSYIDGAGPPSTAGSVNSIKFEDRAVSRRKSRKPSLSTSRILLPGFIKTNQAPASSVADLFPKASNGTRDFIRDIEQKEKEIRSISSSRGLLLSKKRSEEAMMTSMTKPSIQSAGSVGTTRGTMASDQEFENSVSMSMSMSLA